jgi:Grx4 family monothiol glutaredoxin
VHNLVNKVKQNSFKFGSSIISSPNIKSNNIEDKLKALINRSPVMVFMKGSPDAPRCGFSRTLVSILNELNIKYDTFDILSDENVRQELKTYSNWPTYPQIYANGNLIGGLDIVKVLFFILKHFNKLNNNLFD